LGPILTPFLTHFLQAALIHGVFALLQQIDKKLDKWMPGQGLVFKKIAQVRYAYCW
jgi:hypothetical protein